MATERRTEGIVYRLGGRTANNCTPKPKDLSIDQPRLREPGLSALERLEAGETAVKIDVSLLGPLLGAFADDPRAIGRPGHVSIAPVDTSGGVDLGRLKEWVESRETGFDHQFTQIVLDAIQPGKARGPT
jgi:hypothetical protein